MKQFSLLVVLFLVTATSFAQESVRSLLPQSWLEGVNITTGKPVGNMVGEGIHRVRSTVVCYVWWRNKPDHHYLPAKSREYAGKLFLWMVCQWRGTESAS